MKITSKFARLFSFLIIIVTSIFILSSCGTIDSKVSKLLKNDLNASVEIIKLYYNEEKQGCFVEFQTRTYTDKAVVHLDTGKIEYESDYDYYVEKAEELRNQKPINENELHKYNQKILDSSYPYWSFSVSVFEIDGSPKDSNWTRIK